MAITYITKRYDYAQNSINLVILKPTDIQTGDLLLAFVGMYGVSTDNLTSPAGWTRLMRSNPSGSSRVVCVVDYRIVDGSEPASWTWTGYSSTQDWAGTILVYRGCNTATPINASAWQANGATTNYIAPSVTTTVAECLLVVAWTCNQSGAQPQNFPQGMTVRDTGPGIASDYAFSHGIADEPRPEPGATGTRTATSSVGVYNNGHSIALWPGGGAPYELRGGRFGARLAVGLRKAA